jgi:hypothetical protein
MAGYTRTDTTNNIATGNVINASDLDNEYDAIQAAHNATTGHTHGGAAGEGAPITRVGPVQDVVVSGSAVTPKTDNVMDLGSSSLEFKDLWIDGTANIDSLVADTADINGGTVDGAVIGGASAAAGTFTTATATTVNATTVNTTNLDLTNLEVTNIKAKDGTASATIADTTGVMTVASAVLTTADINGGTVDGVSIGVSSAVTDLRVDNLRLDANTVSTTNTNGNLVLSPNGTGIIGGTADIVLEKTGGSSVVLRNASTDILSGVTIGSIAFDTLDTQRSGTDVGAITLVSEDSFDGTTNDKTEMRFRTFNGTDLTTVLTLNGNGTAEFSAGTVSAPAITTTGDTNTGIFFPAADTIAFTEGGVESMRINSSGNIGIGTNSISARVVINGGTGTSQTRFEVSTTEVQEVATNAAQNAYANRLTDAAQHIWKITSTERMRIDSSGRLLINSTLAANGNFLVNNGTNKNVQIRGPIRLDGSSIQSIQSDLATDSPLEIFCNSAQLQLEGTPLTFLTGGSERMRIDSSGNVGIGTATPGESLTVARTGQASVRIISTSSGSSEFVQQGATTNTARHVLSAGGQIAYTNSFDLAQDFGGEAVILNRANAAMRFSTNGTERVRISAAGDVGIGTTSPATKLHVVGNSLVTTTSFFGDTNYYAALSGSNPVLGFDANDYMLYDRTNNLLQTVIGGTERMRINASGLTSMGTTAAVARLTVQNISTTDSATIDVRGHRDFTATTYGATSIIGVSDQTRNSHDFGAIRFEQNPATLDGGGALVRLFAGGASSSFAANCEFLRGDARGNTNGVDNIQFRTFGTERMRIDGNGNVGIGRTAPNYSGYKTLAIDGPSIGAEIDLYGGGTYQGYLYTSTASAGLGTVISIPLIFSTNNTERMRIQAGGNVLVGTTTGDGLLTVAGTVANSNVGVLQARSTAAGDSASCAFSIVKAANDTTTSQVYIRFGINNYASGCGQINANGTSQAAFGAFSDSRLKENIDNLPPQLANITALRPVEFDYIESEGGGHQIGFIAQEMQEVYPDAVGKREDGMLTVTGWNKTEARLVKAIQEQQTLIENLTTRLNALEGK